MFSSGPSESPVVTGVARRAVTTGASERKRGSCDGERGREKEPYRAGGVETETVRERKSVQLLRVLRVSGGEKIFFSF